MKAAVCYEFGKPLVVEEVAIDAPKAGEIKVRLAACAICHSDIHYMDGAWGGILPAVYGHEAAGIIDEIGPGVTAAAPGDHVVVSLLRSCGRCYFCMRGESHLCEATFAIDKESRLHTLHGQPIFQAMRTGAFAEFVIVHESQVVRVPDNMPLESASLLACGVITGLGAVVNTTQVTVGSSVVIVGCGGVGLNSIQGAVLSGAHPIIAVDLVNEKLGAARKFGATHVVNAAEKDVPKAVADLTEGRGADFVFVTVGSGEAIEQGIKLLRRGGTAVVVGLPSTGVKLRVEAVDFVDNSLHLVGSKMGSTRLHVEVPKLVALYQQGLLKLDQLITDRYPLSEINQAIDAVRQGEALRNVIVF